MPPHAPPASRPTASPAPARHDRVIDRISWHRRHQHPERDLIPTNHHTFSHDQCSQHHHQPRPFRHAEPQQPQHSTLINLCYVALGPGWLRRAGPGDLTNPEVNNLAYPSFAQRNSPSRKPNSLTAPTRTDRRLIRVNSFGCGQTDCYDEFINVLAGIGSILRKSVQPCYEVQPLRQRSTVPGQLSWRTVSPHFRPLRHRLSAEQALNAPRAARSQQTSIHSSTQKRSPSVTPTGGAR